MSTRGCVAFGNLKKWTGVYNHHDSYPTGLGKEVWKRVHKEGLHSVVKELSNYGSWEEYLLSGICEYCGKKEGQPHTIDLAAMSQHWAMNKLLNPQTVANIYPDPEAKHHQHGDKRPFITSENVDSVFIEWVYVLDTTANAIHILVPNQIAAEDFNPKENYDGIEHYKHLTSVSLDIQDPYRKATNNPIEPNWDKIQALEYGGIDE